MKQLIKNEMIKFRAQKTYVVLSCIVLALVVLVSFFTSVLMTPLNNLISYGRDMFQESAAYDWAAEQIQNDPDSALSGVLRWVFKDPKSDGDAMREKAEEALEDGYVSSHAVFLAQAKYYDFRDQNELEAWIVSAIESDLLELYMWREVYDGLQSGLYTQADLANDYYLFYLLSNFVNSETQVYIDMYWDWDPDTGAQSIQYYYHDEEGNSVPCTWADVWSVLSMLKPVCDQKITQIEQYALTLEPDAYYDALIQGKKDEIKKANETIKEIEKDIQELPRGDENYEYNRAYYELELEDARSTVEDLERVIKVYEDLKQKGCSPNSNAFTLVNRLLPGVLESRREITKSMGTSELNDDFALLTIARQSGFKHKLRVLDKAVVAIEYACEHDILPEDMSAGSAKSTFVNNLSIASFLISAVTIVFASMILSREFATGTVRLWVIRPRTRNKLLGSKIATLLLYVCGMMGASFVITYGLALVNHVIDLFFYGESTLFVSNYEVMFGMVVPIPAIVECLWALVILTLPVILYAMLSLFISVLTQKGVLSIVCGMIVLMFATDIQALALIVANYTGAFGYVLQATVLPYLSMDRLLVTALDYGVSTYTMGALDGLGALMGLEDMLMAQIWGAIPYVCSTIVGAIVLALHILALIWASLFAFRKTQIKS